MDYKAIQELIQSMSISTLSYLEVECKDMHITMKKASDNNIDSKNIEKAAKNEVLIVNKEIEDSGDVTLKIENNESDANKVVIASPIVGVFYSSASPDSLSYVKVGDRVKKGDTLCIIEAMKLMNEIESEYDGEIVDILVNNEQMVEYNQPLFRIKLD